MSSHFKWQSAVLADKSLQSLTKLVLMVIGARMNKKGGGAFPSYKTIAEDASMSRRSVIVHVERAVSAGWLSKEVRRKTAIENDSNIYRVSYPDGSVVSVDSGAPDAPPLVHQMHHLVHDIHHPSAPDAPPLVHQMHPNTPLLTHQLTQEKQEAVLSSAKKPKKQAEITLQTFLENCRATGEKPIPEDDPIMAYAESIYLPKQMLSLAWSEFKARYVVTDKKYTDWRAAFRNAVKRNYYKFWFVNGDSKFELTTAGKQKEMELTHG